MDGTCTFLLVLTIAGKQVDAWFQPVPGTLFGNGSTQAHPIPRFADIPDIVIIVFGAIVIGIVLFILSELFDCIKRLLTRK